ncbi:Fc.00g086670.m01.CDS01 [Cosmosporella sp. VM-42]
MSEAEATTKPEVAEEKPVEEQPVVQSEEKAEDKPEEKTEQATDKDSKILKTKAKIDYDNPRNNRKFDPSVRGVTDDPVAIRKQVEFYFGDYNFPQDKFMWESCEGSENKPIKVKTIHSFKRMRNFQPYSAVIAALKDSTFLDISGEEGEEEIKRKVAYKPMSVSKAKVEASSVYVKGFGDENPDTQFELESFFAQFGETKGIKLRRTNENLFKGSVFVTFADEDEAKKFIELEPKPQWKGNDLKIMSKRAYCDEKNDLIRQGKLEPSSGAPKKFYEGQNGASRGRGSFRGGRGGDPDDWKKRRENDQKHGFNDRRGGRGGRGGRGRGRGRGDGGRGGRGGRDRDDRRHGGRDEPKEQKDEAKHSSNDTMPRIQSTAESSESNNNGKRAREDDGAGSEPVAKKVDIKTETS